MIQSHQRGRSLPRPAYLWLFFAATIAAATFMLIAGPRPASADHDAACTADEVCTYDDPAESPYTLVVPDNAVTMTVEVWGGGGGGASGDAGAGGAGGGGGAYAIVTDVEVTPGETLSIELGAGGAGGVVTEGEPVDGAAGGTSSVTMGVDTVASAGGGGGGTGTTGGAGGTVNVGDTEDSLVGGIGGNAGTDSGGGGGGGHGAANAGTDGYSTTVSETPIAVRGAGGAGNIDLAYGGDGAGCESADIECTVEDATAGDAPGTGGGGGAAVEGLVEAPSYVDGADGANGRVVVTFQLASLPTITKTVPATSPSLDLAWLITVTNESGDTTVAIDRTVVITDPGVELAAVTGDGSCEDAFNEDGEIECEVAAEGTLILTVIAPQSCLPDEGSNTITGFAVLVGEELFEVPYEIGDVDTTSVGNPEACWQPEITKTGLEDNANWLWAIEIDNDPPFWSDEVAVDTVVEITDPNVTFLWWLADGDYCEALDDVITCFVPADEEITILVGREGPEYLTCDAQYAFNEITGARAQFVGSGFEGTWYDLDTPAAARAEVNRGEGYCLPDGYVIPLPIPDPVGDPPAPGTQEPGCEVAAGTWSPQPVNPGITISTWGGGNVDEFPLPLATSYWTTVAGEMVGYIPGAPDWVNAEFFSVFPDGDIPACTPFIVAYR